MVGVAFQGLWRKQKTQFESKICQFYEPQRLLKAAGDILSNLPQSLYESSIAEFNANASFVDDAPATHTPDVLKQIAANRLRIMKDWIATASSLVRMQTHAPTPIIPEDEYSRGVFWRASQNYSRLLDLLERNK